MADFDIDYIDDLLDAPFKQQNDKVSNGKRRSESPERSSKKSRRGSSKEVEKEHRSSSSHKLSRRSRSKDRRRSKDKKSSRDEEKSKKDKKRSRTRSKDRRHKSKERDRDRPEKKRDDREKEKDRESRKEKERLEKEREKEKLEKKRSKSPDRRRRRSFSPRPFRRGRTPPNGVQRDNITPEELSPEERDARTIFCMQLSQRVKARDLEEFFSSVGKVRDVRLITCNKTKRFKGIAYVEFRDPESVSLSLGLSGQKLYGIPISVQHTQAEKNRLANKAPSPQPTKSVQQGPTRLYVGSLHFQVTEDMLGDIFRPFGKVTNIQLIKDPETGHSKGYGFITYQNDDDAKEALVQLNGFELAGRPMKVGNVTERLDATHASLDTDEMDRSGIDLGTTGRLQLMVKLAEKTDLEIPQVTANALMASAPQPTQAIVEEVEVAQVATQCFLLVNMFDPYTETDPNWDQEIKDDVIEECNKHGGVLHVFVDVASPEGKVYVKCPQKATAVLAVNALHGRWFAGRVISAAYVPLATYHLHFPESVKEGNLLQMKRV